MSAGATSGYPEQPNEEGIIAGVVRTEMKPAFPLLLAMCLATATAWIGFSGRLYRQLIGGPPVGMGLDALWMGPLMNMLWIGVPALGLTLGAFRWRMLARPAITMTVLGFIAIAELLSHTRRLYWGAELVLAFGLAIQCARFFAGRFRSIERWVPVMARWTVAAYLLATASLFGGRWAIERSRMREMPPGRQGAPNVVLLVLDTVRDFDMSLYGYERRTTPYLAKWAAEGVRFDRAFATAPWTLPSHAGMFTGRFPGELSAWFAAPLDESYPTLAEAFRDNGYATGSFVGNMTYCTWQFGLTRGFLHADDYPITPSMFFWSSAISRRLSRQPGARRLLHFRDLAGRRSAATVNQNFLEWSERVNDRPFFAFLNYFDAHHPYLPPPPFDTLFGSPPSQGDPEQELPFFTLPAGDRLRHMAQYDGAIAYMDRQIDRLLGELQRRGILDNTIVIITSDHGEHWGDHQRLSHGNSLYRQLLQVPLVLRYPARIRGNAVVATPVSLRDLPETVLDLASVPNSKDFPGTSLVPYVSQSASGSQRSVAARPILSGNARMGMRGPQSLIADGFHYIRDPDTGEELYDFERDPRDSLDLVRTTVGRAALPRLRAQMDSIGRYRM